MRVAQSDHESVFVVVLLQGEGTEVAQSVLVQAVRFGFDVVLAHRHRVADPVDQHGMRDRVVRVS